MVFLGIFWGQCYREEAPPISLESGTSRTAVPSVTFNECSHVPEQLYEPFGE